MSQPAQPTTPVEPRHAASVLLLREQRGSIEVLLTRRHENLAFMGGMWVFPGGGLCPADTAAETLATIPKAAQLQCHGLRDLDGHALTAIECQGLAIAAFRETFEETGVLLATTAEGHHADNDVLARMQARRHAILSHPERFATLLQEEHLQLDWRRLVYWAHWVTPSVIPKRFDTRFYLARLPAGQVAQIDAVETTEMTWMTPAALIEAAHDGTMLISHPTLYNLMELDASVRQHVALNAILTAEAQRDVVPVLPKIIKAERRMIVMPWDSEYPLFPGSGVPPLTSYPQRLLSLPPRAAMER